MGREQAVHPERLDSAADKMTEACDKASDSRHHLERAADRLEELVQVWKAAPPEAPDEH
jgi:hypothetical protein